MKKEIILFDLDGMLTDPVEGITKSVQYALGHYGICEEDLLKLTPFIGRRQMRQCGYTGNILLKKVFLRIGRFQGSARCWKLLRLQDGSFTWPHQSRRFMQGRSLHIFRWIRIFSLSAARIWERRG